MTVPVAGELVQAFVPAPLPPRPPIEWTAELRTKFDRAHVELGRLDSMVTFLPNPPPFLYLYVRKEAVLSSMIEGTQSSLADLLAYEAVQAAGIPLDDVREVSNYVSAMHRGLKRLAEGFPLSLRLIREVHEVLLAEGRGRFQAPGEFRRSQNWVGGSRPGNAAFVPPPQNLVIECMGDLELFLHGRPEPTPVLLKAALVHVQFETIHPFLDGNGRLGRLLITLLLCSEGVLREPMLYLSLYFKAHRQRYYELLNEVRRTGNWESWLDFFADAVIASAKQAVATAQDLLAQVQKDRELIRSRGAAVGSALAVHAALAKRPVATSAWLAGEAEIAPATANRALRTLEGLGIVRETTGRKRHRLYAYRECLEILNRGAERPAAEDG